MQYYDLSAQIPTHIVLATNDKRSGGFIQLLPRNNEGRTKLVDEDLWPV